MSKIAEENIRLRFDLTTLRARCDLLEAQLADAQAGEARYLARLVEVERERDDLLAGRVAYYREVIREGEDLIARATAAEARVREVEQALDLGVARQNALTGELELAEARISALEAALGEIEQVSTLQAVRRIARALLTSPATTAGEREATRIACIHRNCSNEHAYDGECEVHMDLRGANEALQAIGDLAHDRSTGPAVPDVLWEIRSMAYDAIATDAINQQSPTPAPEQGGEERKCLVPCECGCGCDEEIDHEGRCSLCVDMCSTDEPTSREEVRRG